ncbi:MAG: hypothetical protein ND895_27035 [Pyrinomonadaceae bacterium]|nr:hypothetical protein [Pyrinomonadaceae bacterium]
MSIYSYNAYSLGINSELLLPELQASAEVATDVSIRFGCLDWHPPQKDAGEDFCFEITSREAHFFWAHLGKFRVRRGTEIVVDPIPEVEERLLRLPLLGTILAVLLHQRGYLVLHASSVAIDGGALIFLGNKGWGKSTMAATLYGRGHLLISDDVVAIKFDDQGLPIVVPGFPQFKLYPEAVLSSLGDDYETLPELAAGYEKRGRPVTERFAQRPVPLKGIYALGCGPVSTLIPLEPQAGLLTLIANSYMSRFGRELLHGVEASSHLRQCTKLIRHIDVYRLERPSSLPSLPGVAQLVEEHFQHV